MPMAQETQHNHTQYNVLFMLSFANKPCMMSVIMLNVNVPTVVAPCLHYTCELINITGLKCAETMGTGLSQANRGW